MHEKLLPLQAARLIQASAGRTLVITGAGVSTEPPSNIPDYRGVRGRYKLQHSKAMTHQEYMGLEANRKRFWARALFGFKSFEEALPNRSHLTLRKLEVAGHVHGIITQNVDRLHHRAGSTSAVELHGRGDMLECQTCFETMQRSEYQQELRKANLEWLAGISKDETFERTADGDAILPDTIDFSLLRVLPCAKCGTGVLKPSYVFFGGSVPRHVVQEANRLLEDAKLVILIGSTAHTFSCFRLLREASQGQRKPVLIVNQGDTRADALAFAKHDTDSCGAFLESVATHITPADI